MSSSKISIILPVYNGARFLRQSIQSILNQTHNNFDLFIIDDCSTDLTPQIISEYCALDSRIKTVRHEKNRLLPGALNTGFRIAGGEYVTWTSDDNLYLPNALQEMADCLDQNPEIAFVYSDYDLIDENGKPIETIIAGDWKKLGLTDVIGGSFMYRRIIHDAIGYYDEEMYLAEDLEFELRAMVNGFNFMPLHKNLYQYRDHPGSLTRTKAYQIFRIHAKVTGQYFPKMTWMSQNTKSRSYLHLASKAFSIRDYAGVAMFIFEGFRQSPLYTLKNILTFSISKRISEQE